MSVSSREVVRVRSGIAVANGARFYVLQVHYYNPGLTAGVFDSSGVRMSLAPAVRTHVAQQQRNGEMEHSGLDTKSSKVRQASLANILCSKTIKIMQFVSI